MALKPPSRGGSNSGIGQGINRRRSRLSEMLVKQTYGGAASSVLTDWVLATLIAKTGTVTGSIAYTGTIVGKEGEPGAVAGTTTYAGTVAGSKGAQGVTASEIVYSGTVTGVASDPDGPVGPTGGGGGGRRRRLLTSAPIVQDEPAPKPERKSGRVVGTIAVFGFASGTKALTGAARSTPTVLAGTVRGSRSTTGAYAERTTFTARPIRGRAVSMHSHDVVRQAREDAELMLLI